MEIIKFILTSWHVINTGISIYLTVLDGRSLIDMLHGSTRRLYASQSAAAEELDVLTTEGNTSITAETTVMIVMFSMMCCALLVALARVLADCGWAIWLVKWCVHAANFGLRVACSALHLLSCRTQEFYFQLPTEMLHDENAKGWAEYTQNKTGWAKYTTVILYLVVFFAVSPDVWSPALDFVQMAITFMRLFVYGSILNKFHFFGLWCAGSWFDLYGTADEGHLSPSGLVCSSASVAVRIKRSILISVALTWVGLVLGTYGFKQLAQELWARRWRWVRYVEELAQELWARLMPCVLYVKELGQELWARLTRCCRSGKVAPVDDSAEVHDDDAKVDDDDDGVDPATSKKALEELKKKSSGWNVFLALWLLVWGASMDGFGLVLVPGIAFNVIQGQLLQAGVFSMAWYMVMNIIAVAIGVLIILFKIGLAIINAPLSNQEPVQSKRVREREMYFMSCSEDMIWDWVLWSSKHPFHTLLLDKAYITLSVRSGSMEMDVVQKRCSFSEFFFFYTMLPFIIRVFAHGCYAIYGAVSLCSGGGAWSGHSSGWVMLQLVLGALYCARNTIGCLWCPELWRDMVPKDAVADSDSDSDDVRAEPHAHAEVVMVKVCGGGLQEPAHAEGLHPGAAAAVHSGGGQCEVLLCHEPAAATAAPEVAVMQAAGGEHLRTSPLSASRGAALLLTATPAREALLAATLPGAVVMPGPLSAAEAALDLGSAEAGEEVVVVAQHFVTSGHSSGSGGGSGGGSGATRRSNRVAPAGGGKDGSSSNTAGLQ